MILYQRSIDTPLGSMVSIGDERHLYLLEFADTLGLNHEIENLQLKTRSTLVSGPAKTLLSIQQELALYFAGQLKTFLTPISFLGTPFQTRVWNALRKIPYGQTISYSDLAASINQPKAARAVGNANGTNQLAIIVPCHRVIHASGGLGGYNGGLARKPKLLAIEGVVI